tara:strand:+ start:661 stop:2709 length:2049 start_codon:yes stop_codon:yes gene_type:complete
MQKKIKIISLGLIFFTSLLLTEDDEIIVLEKKISNLSGWSENVSISSINASELKKLDAQHPKQIFRRVPGIWISRGSGQEHLTAMRSPVLTGPGACGSFLILEDGIPLRPAGFCNVNGLFETAFEISGGIETITGPASSRYGANAMHGVINVMSKPVKDGNSISTNLGPNSYRNIKATLGNQSDWSLNIFGATNDGFRESSGYDQQKLKMRSEFQFNSWEASLNITLTNLNQETAGYITGLKSYKDSSLNRKNLNPEAFRDANSQRVSLNLKREEKNGISILSPFIRKNDMQFLQHFLPGTPVEENSHSSYGILFKRFLNFEDYSVTGGIQIEMADAELIETQTNALTTSSAFNNATRPQGKHYDYEVNSKVYAAFVGVDDLYIARDLLFFADLRTESIKYDYDNRMNSGNTREDGSNCGFGGCYYNRPDDRSDTYNELSVRAGLETDFDLVNYFFQASLGFRPPQINEAYRLQKKQNVSDLDSEKLTMIEMGTTFNLDNLDGSVSIYKSKKRNSIFRDSENFIIDNGKTKHKGIELTLDININETSNLISNFTYGDHKYNFNSDTSMRERIRIGNEIDTSPKIMANLILNTFINDNLSLAFELEHMDSYFTDAANLHEYGGHTLLHFRSNLNYSEKLKLYLRIDNISDKDYAERADFNAFGGDRYFPGLPRETYVGLEYSL